MARVRTVEGLQREARKMGVCGDINPHTAFSVCARVAGHQDRECQSLGGSTWVSRVRLFHEAENADAAATGRPATR